DARVRSASHLVSAFDLPLLGVIKKPRAASRRNVSPGSSGSGRAGKLGRSAIPAPRPNV
ncbi:MAG: hypothetical protein RR983_10390, partial [Massilia sp.]